MTDDNLAPERIVRIEDPASGLEGVIVIHSSRIGPAAGGCRLWHYPDAAALERDALRLAAGMSCKNALAGLPFGGGKAVLRRPHEPFDRERLFEAFGRAVSALEGHYVTAEDVGTSIADMTAAARFTTHVAGLPRDGDRPGGDPSPWTARGVSIAMEAAAQRRFGCGIAGLRVAIQGLGNVGAHLAHLLHAAGARLIIAETRPGVADRMARELDAVAMPPEAILDARADIFAPCALGSVLDADAVMRLKVGLVCGGANNVLAYAEVGDRLAARDILYAPDYVVNAGGIINVAAEYLGWDSAEVERRVASTGVRLGQVFAFADAEGLPPNLAADRLARRIIAGEAANIAMAGPATACR